MKEDLILRIGEKWHLHSKNGVYTLLLVLQYGDILLTTKHWKLQHEQGQRNTPFIRVPLKDLKCKFRHRLKHS